MYVRKDRMNGIPIDSVCRSMVPFHGASRGCASPLVNEMALIKCSECEREISDRAAACPACGAPVAPIASTSQSTQDPSGQSAPVPANLRLSTTSLNKLQMVGLLLTALGACAIWGAVQAGSGRVGVIAFLSCWMGGVVVIKKSPVLRIGGSFLLACMILVVVITVLPRTESPPAGSTASPRSSKLDEEGDTKEIVDRFLVAPATAQYRSVKIVERAPGGYVLAEVTVDAQNKFGALIRNHYHVAFHYDPTGMKMLWQPEYAIQSLGNPATPTLLDVFKSLNGWPGTDKKREKEPAAASNQSVTAAGSEADPVPQDVMNWRTAAAKDATMQALTSRLGAMHPPVPVREVKSTRIVAQDKGFFMVHAVADTNTPAECYLLAFRSEQMNSITFDATHGIVKCSSVTTDEIEDFKKKSFKIYAGTKPR